MPFKLLPESVYADTKDHLEFMYNECVKRNAQVVVELGVFMGNSTKAFLQAVEETGGKLISIDKDNYCHTSISPNWIFMQADDNKIIFHTPIDVLFIDTSHSFEHTLQELINYAPAVKSGGVILLHDTLNDGEEPQSHSEVYKAVEKYLESKNGTYTFTNRLHSCGMGVMEKMKNDSQD